jgi:hypothetical protein
MAEPQLPKLLAYLIIDKRIFGTSVRPVAYGRLLPVKTQILSTCERLLWVVADISDTGPNCGGFVGNSHAPLCTVLQ